MPQKITDTHPQYDRLVPLWQQCRDAVAGEEKIKEGGSLYLPRLEGLPDVSMDGLDDYERYKARAVFYNVSGRVVQGLVGCAFRYPPKLALPKNGRFPQDLEKSITSDGLSLNAFARTLIEELLTVGRYGVLVDLQTEQEEPDSTKRRPFLSGYPAESISNWRISKIRGKLKLSQVILMEDIEVEDEFGSHYEKQYRELYLDSDGLYVVRIWEKKKNVEQKEEWVIKEIFTPRVFDERLDFIPFRVATPTMLSIKPARPPILDVTYVNLAHYRNSADYEHLLHFASRPTPIVSGVTDAERKAKEWVLGSSSAWIFGNPQATANILEFTGAAAAAFERAQDAKERQMVLLGTRLLEQARRDAETYEALQLRQAGDNATLMSIVSSGGEVLELSIRDIVAWYGDDPEDVKLEMNTDFFDASLSSAEVTTMVDSWVKGALPRKAMLWNMKWGEWLPPDMSVEDAEKLLDKEPKLPRYSEEYGAGGA